MIQFDF